MLARDRRQDLLNESLSEGYPATDFLSLNIPGAEKNPPGAERLFSWALRFLLSEYPDRENVVQSSDPLGPFAIFLLNREAAEVKRSCITMEVSQPFARLIDLDIFDGSGHPVDRAILGIHPRTCLLCDQAAVDCIRLQRHAAEEVLERSYELLTLCRD